jgi:chaperonin cofactor prefoldin
MTLFKPTLKVNRLVVFQGGHRAFDGVFHNGVNVIRGRNSSGKTTLMDLLAFSLGAENIRWKPEALQCTSTMVEISLNGNAVSLKRDISLESQRPISIFWGPITDAFDTGPQDWEMYPFKRSSQKISFSQAILNALELPQAQGDGASNLTLHQILRVLYADQPSVHSPIFRLDSFDSHLTREMTGSYLCGAFDDELYSSQLRVRDVDQLLSEKIRELKSIFTVLGRSGYSENIDFHSEKILKIEDEKKESLGILDELKKKREKNLDSSDKAKKNSDELRKKLNSLHKKEASIIDEITSIELDIADSLQFIRELEARLENIGESKETRAYFKDIIFQFCPVCLAELNSEDVDDHCRLCKSNIDGGKSDVQLLKMRNELSVQLGESKSLVIEREKRAVLLRQELPSIVSELKDIAQKYLSQSSSWSTNIELEIEGVSRKLGELDADLRQAHELGRLVVIVNDLKAARDKLQNEKNDLVMRIETLELLNEDKIKEIKKSIESALVRFLKLDIPLQPEFVNAEFVSFDFGENSVYVNGIKNFSESSAVVLRHLFHLALLDSSVNNSFMRLPRFMMLDGIDDGGMEIERSHRLQEIIVDECEKYSVEFQLIFATSEINPKFEDSDYVVGRHFNPASRSLNVLPVFGISKMGSGSFI